jgi:hypothetical protein
MKAVKQYVFSILLSALLASTAFAADVTVNLNWSDAGGETGYVLQRNPAACSAINSNDWTQVATLPANTTSYVDTVAGGVTYCYRVAATVGGVLQGWSNLHEVPTTDPIVPITLSGGQVE